MAKPYTSVFLTESDAAEYLGLSKETLQRWCFDRKGPAYARLNAQLIRYHLGDLDEWMSQQTVTPEDKESPWRLIFQAATQPPYLETKNLLLIIGQSN
tara:strand:+ start:389 stop:682 length:294 start_codon:yes stop_codon:yes gene_type:complete